VIVDSATVTWFTLVQIIIDVTQLTLEQCIDLMYGKLILFHVSVFEWSYRMHVTILPRLFAFCGECFFVSSLDLALNDFDYSLLTCIDFNAQTLHMFRSR
jgi:hypothetical protein